MINTKALLNAPEHLASWQLNTIALWSCSTGADLRFTAVLEELSGATVWASDQRLGQLNAETSNWQLNSPNNHYSPILPVERQIQLSWQYQLVDFPLSTGGDGNDSSTGITALSDGSMIITGVYAGDVDFGDTEMTSDGISDIDGFIAKINPDGT